MNKRMVTCFEHGESPACFICTHIMHGAGQLVYESMPDGYHMAVCALCRDLPLHQAVEFITCVCDSCYHECVDRNNNQN